MSFAAAVTVDDDGCIRTATPEFERLAGAPRRDLIGRRLDSLLDLGAFDVPWRAGEDRGTPASPSLPATTTLRRPEDGALAVEVRMRPLGEAPARNGTIVSVQPADRSPLERARARHERQLEVALAAASLIPFERNLASGEMRLPPEGRALLGLPLDGPITVQQLIAIVHPLDRERLSATLRAARDDGARVHIEWRAVRQDGTTRWIAGTAIVVAPPGEEPTTVGTFQDVTQQHEDAQRVIDSEARLRRFLDAIPQLAWIGDPTGRVIYANHRWIEVTGVDPTARPLQAAILDEVVHADDREGLLDSWIEAHQAGQPFERSARLWDRRAREFRWHLSRAVPARDATGRTTAWFITATDIHEQKRAEEALREANDLKDDFVRFVSHELRTPLTLILGYVRHLRGRPDPPAPELVADALDEIATAADQLNAMVQNLLAMAMADKVDIELEPVSVRVALRAVLDRIERQFPDRAFGVAIEPQIDPALANVTWLEQVLGNLLVNAARHTPPDAEVSVSAESSDGEVRVRVLDRGSGLAPDTLARVFEPFFRASGRSSRSGMGLGLSVCQRLVELQGGRIWAAARDGGGLEFGFALPAAELG